MYPSDAQTPPVVPRQQQQQQQQQQRWPRGPETGLHQAAFQGSAARTIALLSRGSIDIDQGNPEGWTPLMVAVQGGHSHVARTLLGRGANVSIVGDHGTTALHLSARFGHLAVTADLVKAGAELEAEESGGSTPLRAAAEKGHSEVMAALIQAGADVDSSSEDGRTPLHAAAQHGKLAAAKQLLREGANPLISIASPERISFVPLDAAAYTGHPEVVRELIQQVGIEGCGGDTGGLNALELAAAIDHVEIMTMLVDAGVVDTGSALMCAVGCGRQSPVKFLLQQQQLAGFRAGLVGYVNFLDTVGKTPLFRSVDIFGDERGAPCLISPKVVRLLIDAGADAPSVVRATNTPGGIVYFNGTPLAFTNDCLRKKKVRGVDATEEQMYQLEAVRRLLMRVEAVHATSWLWVRQPLRVGGAAGRPSSTARKTVASGTQLASMLPISRRRRRGVLLAPLFRYSSYP